MRRFLSNASIVFLALFCVAVWGYNFYPTTNADARPFVTADTELGRTSEAPPPPQAETTTAEPGAAPAANPQAVTVYITRTGEKYHRGSCQHLHSSKIPVTLTEAIRRGYTPCRVCRPPR